MKNIIKISSVFIGTVIGAGFASGQEIMQYYVRFGNLSFLALNGSCLLFGFLCAIVLCKIYSVKARNLEEYFKDSNMPHVVNLIGYIITVFMFACLCVMIAGSGAIFKEQLNLPYWGGVAVLCIICICAFWFGAKGLVAVNVVITPIMIIGILFLGVYIFLNNNVPAFAAERLTENLPVSSLIYVSYNSLALIVVMTAMTDFIDSRKTAIYSSLIGSLSLCIIASVLWFVLNRFNVSFKEMPILSIVNNVAGIASKIYFPVLYMAIITTALANGFGVLQSFGLNHKLFGVIICLAGSFVSFAGFSTLVAKAYGFFGYIGIPILILTIVDGIKYLKLEKNRKILRIIKKT